MYVLTVENDVILTIAPVARQLDNGVFTGNAVYGMPNIKIHEVAEVPETAKAQSFCYTPEKGFFKNPDYVPHKSTEERLTDLEEQLKSTRAALDFLLLGGL